jgi:hypothetical protein
MHWLVLLAALVAAFFFVRWCRRKAAARHAVKPPAPKRGKAKRRAAKSSRRKPKPPRPGLMIAALSRLRTAIERRLVRNWRKVLRHSWSVRLLGLAFAFSAAEVALPYLQSVLPLSAGWFGAVSGLATGAAFVARLLAQKQFDAED